jgi:hypothetical protein
MFPCTPQAAIDNLQLLLWSRHRRGGTLAEMIRRASGGKFILFTQVDHAALSGQLAARFGGGRFVPPVPREVVLTAVSQHDAGWPLHDDEPTLNSRGEPLDVFEVPRQIALRVWSASAERASAIDPYAGLLVSLHSLSLSIHASMHNPIQLSEKFDIAQMQSQFDLNKFQHREVERQEQLRRKLGMRTDVPLKHGIAEPGVTRQDDQLRFHFRLLQAMDLLSLCICCTHPPAAESNELQPSPDAGPVRLKIHRGSDGVTHVHPWPFEIRRLPLTIPCRHMPERAYQTVQEFRECFLAAPVTDYAVVVMP